MKRILLSFDVEEFDLPRERGGDITLEEGIKVSESGLMRVLEMLERVDVKATFFCTGNFASARPKIIKQMVESGHEIACHGVDHFAPKDTDIEESKKLVEKAAGVMVDGYRQPRMQRINYEELARCGYSYDSSVNPAYIPGRYNNSKVPRKPFSKNEILEIPTSVATSARIPMFWLALHLFPKRMYLGLVRNELKRSDYFATYFHPWEFADLMQFGVVPGYIKHNSGEKLVGKLEWVILKLKEDDNEFVTFGEFARE